MHEICVGISFLERFPKRKLILYYFTKILLLSYLIFLLIKIPALLSQNSETIPPLYTILTTLTTFS